MQYNQVKQPRLPIDAKVAAISMGTYYPPILFCTMFIIKRIGLMFHFQLTLFNLILEYSFDRDGGHWYLDEKRYFQ